MHWFLLILSAVAEALFGIATFYSRGYTQLWPSIGAVAAGASTAVLLAFAHGGAWALGAVLKLPRGDRIALLFAAGQKSMALGAPLATVLFPPATAGLILLPLLVYHLAQMVLAAPVATRLRAGGEAAA